MIPDEEKDIHRILGKCARGDQKAQAQLYTRYYRYALGICIRFSRSEAEALEIVNDGFFKILSNAKKFNPGLSFKGWLRRIMINACIDSFRRNEKHYNNLDLNYAQHLDQISPEVFGILEVESILKAIQQLPPSYQIVFNLYVIEGYHHEEIAQKLNISVGTSKSNLNVARTKLKKLLRSEFERKTQENG